MVVWVWTVTVVEALLCTLLANDVAHNGGIVGLRRCREIKDHYMVVVVVGLSVVRSTLYEKVYCTLHMLLRMDVVLKYMLVVDCPTR